jgi:hypothetical protein
MIITSPDGQWAAVRRGREISLLANATGPASARIAIDTGDADLALVGPPTVLAVVTRAPAAGGDASRNRLVLYRPPHLDAVAELELDAAMRIAAITGPRLVLISLDGAAIVVVRIAGRALAPQALDPGAPVEFAVGLERNQVLFGWPRKLEAWDAVSGRPLLRMQLPLPPPPRTIGPAQGHLWAMRPGGHDLLVCRLSDGRPFQHQLGTPIDDVIYHPSSPLLVLATAQGLLRLHCFAHSLAVIDAPWRPGDALAQLVVGDDIALVGLHESDAEPWRVAIAGTGAPTIAPPASDPGTEVDRARAPRPGLILETRDLSSPYPPPTAASFRAPAPAPRVTSPDVGGAALAAQPPLDAPESAPWLPDTSHSAADAPGPPDPTSRGSDLGDARSSQADPRIASPVDPAPWNTTADPSYAGPIRDPAPWNIAAEPPHAAPSRDLAPWNAAAGPSHAAPSRDPASWNSAADPSHAAPNRDPAPWNTAAEPPHAAPSRDPAPWSTAAEPPHAAPNRDPAPWNIAAEPPRWEPGSTEIARWEEIPVEPAPWEPAASYPAPAYPGPSYPAPAYPGPSYPATAYPAPRDPVRAQPAPRDPTPHDPARAQPAPSNHTAAPLARQGTAAPQTWREPLIGFAIELLRGPVAEIPRVSADTELAQLAESLALPTTARQVLIILYSLHLIGEPRLAIAQLAHLLGDWTEALGRGELHALAMLRRRRGRLALRAPVTDLLDQVEPRAIRVVGDPAAPPPPGAFRLARRARPDPALESELTARLGRIAIIQADPRRALLEARLRGAAAVALSPPPTRPIPWPRDASLIIVADHPAPAWVTALPGLPET